MNKAVFLDRDGTINRDKGYLWRIEDFEFLPGAIEGLKLLQKMGFLLIIISNQSGIARGYYTEENVQKLHEWMQRTLVNYGVFLDGIYYCPHHPSASVEKYRQDCNCRKPKPGLFLRAAKDFDIDFSKSYAVGDKLRDCSICEMEPCRGFLIGQNEDPLVILRIQKGSSHQIRYADDLYQCAKVICSES